MSSGSTSPVRAGQYKEAHSYHTSSQSTPPSSPPSVHNMSEKDFEPVSKAMLAEEKKMHARRKAEEQAETRKRALEMSGSDADQQNKEYARLMHLVNQSKVRWKPFRMRYERSSSAAEAVVNRFTHSLCNRKSRTSKA